MTESTQGILVLLGTSAVSGVLFHYFLPSLIKASVLSAVLASVLFQVLAYFHLGHLDPFFVIALFTGGAIAFVVALFIGVLFQKYRRHQGVP